MRTSSRLLAQASRFLTPGAPTGLTGVLTHAAPRPTLLYLYNSTLDKLKQFPEHSIYRQSVEALTKNRLAIVESVKPEGLAEWQTRVRSVVEAHPNAFRQVTAVSNKSDVNFIYKQIDLQEFDPDEFEDDPTQRQEPEGPRNASDKSRQAESLQADPQAENKLVPRIEPEPPLTAEQ
jgi:NADH dehydrogenase (ubiquinone) 1 alpha subcomplex subunit 5